MNDRYETFVRYFLNIYFIYILYLYIFFILIEKNSSKGILIKFLIIAIDFIKAI